MMVQAILAVAIVAGGLPVRGPSECPTAPEVAALLPELLPEDESAYPDTAWIEAAGLGLQIELRSHAGDVLFSRRLTSHGTCAELATVAAVVIASWVAERDPDISLRQPGMPLPRTASPPMAAVKSQPKTAAPSGRLSQLDISVGLGGSANSAGWVGATRAEAGARGRRLGARVGFATETSRDATIGKGGVSWRRYGLSAGPSVSLVQAVLELEARAELFAGLTTATGHDLDANRQSTGLAPGVGVALRLGTMGGWLRPWIDLGGQYWLADQEIAITREPTTNARVRLPRIEARIFAGISVMLLQ